MTSFNDYKANSDTSVMDTKELQIAVPWGVILGTTWGDPNDYPVLMVHGIQDNAGSFENLVPLLPRGFFYICIDLPGHGKSSHYPKGFPISLLLYIPCIKRIVDTLKLEKFHYVGHSYGAHIGFHFIGCFPHMVSKFAILDANLKSYNEKHMGSLMSELQNDFVTLQYRLETGTPPAYTYEEAVQRLISNRPSKISEDGAKLLLKRSLVKSKDGYQYSSDQRNKLENGVFYSFQQNKSYIDRITCPIFVIMAKETYYFCKNEVSYFEELYKDVRDFNVVLVDGNHNVHIDFPERVAPSLSNFLIKEKCSL